MGTVIDTSVVVAIERALLEPGSVSLDTLPHDCLIPSIVLMELRVGALLADTEARRLARERFASDLCEASRLVPSVRPRPEWLRMSWSTFAVADSPSGSATCSSPQPRSREGTAS